MEIPAEAASLLLTGVHELLTRSADLTRQGNGGGGGGQDGGELVDHLSGGAPKRVLAGIQADEEHTH